MAQQSWFQWFVYTSDYKQLWAAQPSYLLSQAVFILAGLVTVIHAFRKGGRWPYLWLATVLHGLYTGNFLHALNPEYDIVWHSQSPVMLFGARLPLHIVFLYPAFIYHAVYAVSKLNLPKYAEAFAVGLVTVLVDIPYDIVGVKFAHWTWHDTDPNIYDRTYWVPWNSYYFHAIFATSFYFLFQSARKWMAPRVAVWDSAGLKTELKALIVAVLLGMPLGALLFVPVYHPLHDIYGIHTEVISFALLAVYTIFILNGLLCDREKSKEKLTTIDYVLLLQLAAHYIIYLVLVVVFHPEKEWSLGFHETVGPCNEVTQIVTPIGLTIYKRKWFCPTDYDEGYFDFHCVGQYPLHGQSWYAVCGTPFANRFEYTVILSSILAVAAGVFYGLYFRTQATTPAKKLKTK